MSKDGVANPGTDTVTEAAAQGGQTPSSTAKVVVVMPARQAAATLRQTVSEIPLEEVSEIILVDDSSTDETVRLARELPVEVVWHPHQVGYGGNQKTCYLLGPPARCGRGGDAPPGRPVRARPDPADGRADRRGPCRPRPRLTPADPGRGPGGRHAALEIRRQPVPDDDPEPHHGHRGCRRLTPATARTRGSCS